MAASAAAGVMAASAAAGVMAASAAAGVMAVGSSNNEHQKWNRLLFHPFLFKSLCIHTCIADCHSYKSLYLICLV
jgi:hypothetical protein